MLHPQLRTTPVLPQVYLGGSPLGYCLMLLPVLGLSDKPKAERSREITKEFCALGKLPCDPKEYRVVNDDRRGCSCT